MEYKLYVGNLSYEVGEADLQALFAEAGTVKSVAVIMDKFTGKSKGFAFVEMADEAAMQNAITTLNGREFKGRALTVNVARPREERRDFGGGSRNSSGGPRKHKAGTNRRQY